jgi:hypothetical protein
LLNRPTWKMVMTPMDSLANQQDKFCELKTADTNASVLSDNEWTIAATIDELLRNLAVAEQIVTNKAGQTLTIRRYQFQCKNLAPYIPIALPTPEYLIHTSDLTTEVRKALKEIHHPELRRQVLHQAVLRLFEAVGIEPYISIGRKLIVKLIED